MRVKPVGILSGGCTLIVEGKSDQRSRRYAAPVDASEKNTYREFAAINGSVAPPANGIPCSSRSSNTVLFATKSRANRWGIVNVRSAFVVRLVARLRKTTKRPSQ